MEFGDFTIKEIYFSGIGAGCFVPGGFHCVYFKKIEHLKCKNIQL
jgi:hypothetical protein